MKKVFVASGIRYDLALEDPRYIRELVTEGHICGALKIAPAVAKAAAESGVATRPIADLEAYQERLQQLVYHSGSFMKPAFQIAKAAPDHKKRIVFAEGEAIWAVGEVMSTIKLPVFGVASMFVSEFVASI